MIDEAPTLAERYAASLSSSNLRSRDSGRNEPIDLIAAMGWCGDGIGAMLLRLRTEYDAVHGEHRKAAQQLSAAETIAARLRADARENNSVRLADAARVMAVMAEQEALKARAFVLLQLKTLASVRVAMGDLAVIEATRQRFMRNDQAAAAIAGRCLDVWLDPTCPPCEGRGYVGGGRGEHSGPLITCRACRSTGNREVSVGRDDEERRFASHLLGLMGDALRAAESGAQTRMRG